jgi:2-polyprenyl-6-methoxyphenol hydroxylase-like FAD-dependent oxidoreductase
MTTTDDAPIVVAGAGIGGLTLALGLARRGIPCRVFERHGGLSEVGAGITLWSNALRVLDYLGVGDEVRRLGCHATMGVMGLADGTVLTRTEQHELASCGVSMLAFHRAELQRALYESLPEGTVTFGGGVDAYKDGEELTVQLNNGAQLAASLLVGADGLRSRIRQQLLGDTPLRYAGYACYRAVCPTPVNWGRTCGEFMGSGDRFGLVEIPGKRLYWYAVMLQPQGGPKHDNPKAALHERFRGFGFDVPAIIEATEPESLIFHELFDRAPVSRWSEGHVTLLGDAAHPTTPNLGQGAAMAMESALVLTRLIGEKPTEATSVLGRYERTRYVRTRTVTETSRTVGRLAHLRNPLLRVARNVVFAYTPARLRMRQIKSIVDFDASTCPLAV